jgi:hypothetical protein
VAGTPDVDAPRAQPLILDERHLLVAVSVFATGVFSFLLTGLWPMTLTSWWKVALARVVWQVGGSLWVAGVVVAAMRRGQSRLRDPAVVIAVFAVIALLLAHNPLLDLLRGPERLQGHLAAERVSGGRKSIFVRLIVRKADGSRTELRLRGLQANVWGWRSQGCDRSRALTLTYLRHLDNLLAVECSRPVRHRAPR